MFLNEKKNELLEMIDEGYLSAENVVDACLAYMTEEDVAKMMHNNEFGYKFFKEEDEEIDHQSDDEDFDYLTMDLESDLDGD